MEYPQFKIVYLFDENGEYISEYNAQLSPLENGIYIMPTQSTAKLPPVVKDKTARVFVGNDWSEVPDHRGNLVYKVDTLETIKIEQLGGLPSGILSQVDMDLRPNDNYDYLFGLWVLNIERKRSKLLPLSRFQVRKVLTQFGLRQLVEDAVASGSYDLKDEWSLRDSFERKNETLCGMAMILGISDEQLDEMFEIGVTL